MPNMTIKDIARLSGCSVSTISRVINDRPDVRPETKEKVLQMMRESGFVPNTNARQLKIQQSRSLVFVVKYPEPLLLGLPRSAAAGRDPLRVQRHRLLPGRECQRDRRRPKDPAGDKAQRHDIPRRQRGELPAGLCEHHRPLGADDAGLRRAGFPEPLDGGRG